MMPQRIQRKRTKGWRMPEGAVYVGRPSLFGNPWRPSDARIWGIQPEGGPVAWCVRKYRQEMKTLALLSEWSHYVSDTRWHEVAALKLPTMADYARHFLRGKDLVCWCALDAPCHADVLLEIANAPLPKGAP